jgi:drug/metabolite transporter (DMT)-like permease
MNLRDTLILILLAAIWGASFLFMRIAVADLGAIVMIQLRIGIGAACLLPIMLLRFRDQFDRNKLAHMTVVGITNSALPFTLLAYSTIHVTAGYTALLNSSVPLWSAIIAALWLRDWLTRWQVLGIFLGFIGVFVLIQEKAVLTLSGPTMAIIASTLATMCYGFSANYTKRYLSGVPAITIATMSLLMASVCMLPLTLTYWPQHVISKESWLYVVVLGCLCTALAYILFYGLIKRVGPTKTVSVTFLVPVFGVFWGYIFLHESITMQMIAGSIIIFAGTSLTLGLVKPKLV